ncbi:MAG: hypothetical protein FWD47_08380 [Treponema sp.]|nr:hypothetical protein [Treponema sp.]
MFYTKDDEIRHQLGDELTGISKKLPQIVGNNKTLIRQQLVDELENHPIFQIPWGHHIQIFTKSKSIKEAMFYVQKTIK